MAWKKGAAPIVVAALLAGGIGISSANAAAVLKGEYLFNNSLASDVAGAPDLTATDPSGLNTFGTDTPFGISRTVYNYAGTASPPSGQAGLSFNNSTGLLTNNSYSIDLVQKFVAGSSGWRRLIDVQNRQSDSGFYVDPGNRLDVFPVTAGSAAYTAGVYHQIALTDNAGVVSVYFDGGLDFTATTTVMDINNPENLINFFLDNTVGGGQGEFANGSIAALRLYDGVLNADQVAALHEAPFTSSAPPTTPPSVPEPGTLALLASGLLGLGAIRRRKAG